MSSTVHSNDTEARSEEDGAPVCPYVSILKQNSARTVVKQHSTPTSGGPNNDGGAVPDLSVMSTADTHSVHSDHTDENHIGHSSVGRENGGDADGTTEVILDLTEFEKARQLCPAFQAMEASANSNNDQIAGSASTRASASACPFARAKSPSQVLQQLPPSHLNPEGVVYRSLEKLHRFQVQHGVDVTGKPVTSIVGSARPRSLNHSSSSFHQTLEDFSLASIMAQMVHLNKERQRKEAREGTEKAGEDDDRSITSHDSMFMDDDDDVDDYSSKPTPTAVDKSMAEEEVEVAVPTELKESTSDGTHALLSDALKEGTAVSHQQAEHVHFVKNFIKGDIERSLYAQLVVDLYHVYVALEDALDKHAPKHFQSCHFPHELARRKTLEDDLDFWHGLDVSKDPSCVPPMTAATRDYVDRIEFIARTDPLLLLSHAYTRYLGDLSGGKILCRVARRALHLDKKSMEGLAFYGFENIKSAKRFKDMYRDALDSLSLTDEQTSRVVHEANVAFGLNMRIFEELDVQGGVIGASVRPLQEIVEYDRQHGTRQNTAAAECPFASLANSSVMPKSLLAEAQRMHGIAGVGTEAKVAPPIHDSDAKCPWPFILLHDPVEGLKQWPTWAVLGAIAAWCLRSFA